jgi:nicotinate-nucleotide adenylyltransferase
MRIAFFGGTFDPPHRGHLAIAGTAADRLQLDRVLFAPVGNQPLKHDSSVTSFDDRVAMVKLAIMEDPRFELSTIDAPHADERPNYTIDTIHALQKTLRPEDRLFCLVGADSFLSLPRWHRAGELLLACDFIVAGRPGFDFQDAEKTLPGGVHLAGVPHHESGLSAFPIAGAGKASTLYFLPDLHEEISATEVRSSAIAHLIRVDALPLSVAEYIQQHHLYRGQKRNASGASPQSTLG